MALGAGEWGCRAVPGDLCPGVEVKGPHGAQHLNAPHVLWGEKQSEQQHNRAGNGEERPEKGLSHQLQGSHSSFHPHPKTPHYMPRPSAKTPQTHLCATACDASQGLTTLESQGGLHGPANPWPPAPSRKLHLPGAAAPVQPWVGDSSEGSARSRREERPDPPSPAHAWGRGLRTLPRDLPGQCRRRRAPAPARRGAASPAPVCG